MWIGRVDGDVTDGVAALLIEDRLPRHAGVIGFPYATGTDTHVPNAEVSGMPGDIRDTARHKRGANIAPFEAR